MRYRDGNDGPWSSFQVDLGSSTRQPVRVFPGFEASSIYAVGPEGCKNNDADCLESRGRFFDTNSSSTWESVGIYSLDSGLPFNLPHGETSFGLEHVSFGIGVSHQLVAAFADTKFWLGLFGLSFSNMTLNTQPNPEISFLERLRRNQNITSRTWSYTAGAYHSKPELFYRN